MFKRTENKRFDVRLVWVNNYDRPGSIGRSLLMRQFDDSKIGRVDFYIGDDGLIHVTFVDIGGVHNDHIIGVVKSAPLDEFRRGSPQPPVVKVAT